MKYRKTTVAVLVVVFTSLLLFAAWFAHSLRQSRLANYRSIIDTRFQDELALIEQKAAAPADELDHEVARETFETALGDPTIYFANWSKNGDRATVLKYADDLPGGRGPVLYTEVWPVYESDDGSHSLRYGETPDGRRLLVSWGYNPDASMRHYEIAFFLDAVDAGS